MGRRNEAVPNSWQSIASSRDHRWLSQIKRPADRQLGRRVSRSEGEAQQETCERAGYLRAVLRLYAGQYLEHYKGSSLPEMLKEGPEFIVGGFGRDDEFPSLYRVSVQANKMQCEFGGPQTGAHRTGIAWNGQSDAVERFARGYDSKVKCYIEERIAADLKSHGNATATYVTDTINKLMDSLGQTIPTDFKLEIPELKGITLDWRTSAIDCDYANLPLQEAVNFVSFLVLMQAGRSRFARGIPTVGGRTHVGVITKDKGFQSLNEPNLAHQYTGFIDDN
jgi:hypothetical protein